MASEFVETMQKVEEMSHLLAKMKGTTIDEVVQRIQLITAFIDRYGGIERMFEHFQELESKAFMCREMLTVEEAAEYIGVSKSQIYLMTSNREITYYKPKGKIIYIERKELDDLRRRNVVYSKKEMERRAIAASTTEEGRGKCIKEKEIKK